MMADVFPSTTCCPQGALLQNGICYCTMEQSVLNPHACRVSCQSLNYTLPAANGGCVCPPGFAGELCDQQPCHVFDSSSASLKFYCLDNFGTDSTTGATTNVVADCNNLANLLGSDRNVSSTFPPCPCSHGGQKVFLGSSEGHHSCLCPEPYVGDLCHIEPYDSSSAGTTDPVTANAFLAIIAFAILTVTFLICCGRWYQRRKRRHLKTDFHQYHISQSEYHRGSRRTADFFTTYVPLLPMFLGNSQENNENQNGKKTGIGSVKEENPLKTGASQEPHAEATNANVLFFEDMHDLIKKCPS